MNVSIETMSGLERRMTIVVPSESFETEVRNKLEEAARKVRLDGFRPGRVPMREVRRRFGKAVRQEVAGELMQHSFVDAVRQEEVNPAGTPSLEVLSMEPGVDLEFTATFEVFPTVELARLETVEVTRPKADVADADIDRMIDDLRSQRKTWTDVDRESTTGDRVTIDFVGRIDDEVFEGGTGEDVEVELGQGRMLEDFEKQLSSVTAGAALSFDVTFPGDYGAEALRGKTARFDVTVKSVAEPTLPNLDDAFFASFGVSEGGLEAFRTEVSQSMAREMEGAVRAQLKRQVMDQLDQLHEMQLPESLVTQEIQSLRQQMQQRLQNQGGDLPDFPDDLFRDEARRRVKLGLLLNEIVDRNEVKASPEKVRAHIEQQAQGYPQPQQLIDFYYSSEEHLRQVQMAVLEDAVVDCILDKARITEHPSNYQDIMAGKAVPGEGDGDEPEAGAPEDHSEPG